MEHVLIGYEQERERMVFKDVAIYFLTNIKTKSK